jgi:hypothetical protein
MESFLIRLKDSKHRAFLLELLSRLEFIELTPTIAEPAKEGTAHDLFESAGMWADYAINAETLRKSAWSR